MDGTRYTDTPVTGTDTDTDATVGDASVTAPMPDAFLGVAGSYGGRRWVQRPADDRHALAIEQRLGLPDPLGRVLAARGVTPDTAQEYLNPTLRGLLPDPSTFLDMDRAAERLADAVQNGETIAIFGDYDVDGATSSAVLCRYLRLLGCDPIMYVPDRLAEGYGPNGPALERLAAQGVSVIVTVDCGTAAHGALAIGKSAGLDIIVCDHHDADAQLPPAHAVVNPKRLDESGAHTELAAVGVVFLLVVALNRLLRQHGQFAAGTGSEPDLKQLLDLVALGTVCDMVPLTGLNRAFVTQGLRVMGPALTASGSNAGLAALIASSRLSETPTAFHLGYMLGPRVNAGGRVGRAGLGADLLTCDDPIIAARLAAELEALNAARKDVEAAVLAEAMEQAESRPIGEAPLLFVSGAEWHPGVIGIVAGRLKERYNLPACAVAIDGGLAKGSGRSIPGLDLGQAVIAAREAGLLEAGGGHAMAAGFTVTVDKMAAFQEFLGERLALQVAARLRAGTATDPLLPLLELDGVVSPQGATVALIEDLERAGPYGSGNPDPRFAMADVTVKRADVVGMGHIRAFLSGPDGGRIKAMAFKAADEEMGIALLSAGRKPLHVAGTLRIDRWSGSAEPLLVIDDVARADHT